MKFTENGVTTNIPFFRQEYVDDKGVTRVIAYKTDPGSKITLVGDRQFASKEFGGDDKGIPIQCFTQAWEIVSQTPPPPDVPNAGTLEGRRSQGQQDAIVKNILSKAAEIFAAQKEGIVEAAALDAAPV